MFWSQTEKSIIVLAPMADYTDEPFCQVCREVTTRLDSSASPQDDKKEESNFLVDDNVGSRMTERDLHCHPACRQTGQNDKKVWIPAGACPQPRSGAGMTMRGAVMANPPNLPLVRGGGNFVIFREMVSAEAIARDSVKTLKMCEFQKNERPLVIQIFGAKPEVMAKAAQIILEKFNPDGIDINMGCPVPKIAGKNLAGAALLKDPDRAVEIVKAVKNVAGKTPVSVKTRLGWAKEDEILAFAPRLEAAGIDCLTIHGRTKLQGYTGKANWEMIGKVKQMVKIPVLANGDINDSNFAECLKITGADGVMIGRAALGNPWVFLKNEEQRVKSNDEIVRVVLHHAQLHLEHYGPKSMVTFRKHLLWYFKGNLGIDNQKEFKIKLSKVSSMDELENILGTL